MGSLVVFTPPIVMQIASIRQTWQLDTYWVLMLRKIGYTIYILISLEIWYYRDLICLSIMVKNQKLFFNRKGKIPL